MEKEEMEIFGRKETKLVMPPKVKDMTDIILNDPDFLDVFKWKRKHFEAYKTYLDVIIGLDRSYRKKIIKEIKKQIKRR